MKKLVFLIVIVITNLLLGQLRDIYTSSFTLNYNRSVASRWYVSSQTLVGYSELTTALDYCSTDITEVLNDWEVSTNKGNTWTVWMSDNVTYANGWASGQISCAYVLAANNSNFTSTSCQGYALIYRSDNRMYLVKFSQGINANLESNSTNLSSQLFAHFNQSSNGSTWGYNLYVKYNSDGTWTIKWMSGSKLTPTQAIDEASYTTGSQTTSADFTYNGTSCKYTGYVFNHNNFYLLSYWDNLGFGYNGVLPVEGMNLAFLVQKGKVFLNWQTSTEINNKGFEVERNLGNGWQKIGFVEGKGNSNTTNFYSFVDDAKLYGKVLYRLKQVDNDGKFTYSNEIEVNLSLPKSVELLQNYPNPFNPTTTISYVLPEAGNVTLKVFNSVGQEVATLVNGYQEEGIKHVNFDAANLTSGIYYYTIQFGDVVKSNKMLLVK